MKVYVSHHRSHDIHAFDMNRAGTLRPVGIEGVSGVAGPMALNATRKLLYVAVRTEPWTLITFAIQEGSGELIKRTESPLEANTCYMTVDSADRFLLQASYQGSQIVVNALGPDGLVQTPAIQTVPTPANAHAIVIDPTGRFVFVPCLGGDCTLGFRLDASTGRILPNSPPQVQSPPGTGPRHLRFHPTGRFAYLLHELDATLSVYSLDARSGRLTEMQHVSALAVTPGLRIWAADVQISPDGHFLYTTERGTSSITIFSISQQSGLVTLVGIAHTELQPRAIAIHPRGEWLLSTGELSSSMSVFHIDRITGELEQHERVKVGDGAHWIEMIDLE